MKTYVRSNSSCSDRSSVEDLRLHGHVQRRHRLVADDQPRVEREGAGDADPLPLPAGELVRIAADVLRAQADDLEQLLHPGPDLRAARDPVDPERVADDLLDGLPRVQRRVGVLEDDLHLAAERTQLALGQLGDVPPLEADRALGRVEQAEHEPGGRGLAATRLAHDAERLAAADGQGDVLDGMHGPEPLREHALLDGEVLREVLDLDDRIGRRGAQATAFVRAARSAAHSRRFAAADRWHASEWPPSSGSRFGRSTGQGSNS